MAAKKKTAKEQAALRSKGDVSAIFDRVTRAEERIIAMDSTQVEWRDESRVVYHDLSERLGALEKALTKYQGAWGMLTLLASAIVVAVTLLKGWLLGRDGT